MDAGVSTSLVHYHFETREALLEEALEYSFELAGDVRIGEEEGDAPDPTRRLLAMVDQCLPYPGHARARLDPVGRAVAARGAPPRAAPDRGAALRAHARVVQPRGSRRRRGGEFRATDPERLADRCLALSTASASACWSASSPSRRARARSGPFLAAELGLDPGTPPRARFSESPFRLLGGVTRVSPRPRLDHVRRPGDPGRGRRGDPRARARERARRRRGGAGRHQRAVGPLLLRLQGGAAQGGAHLGRGALLRGARARARRDRGRAASGWCRSSAGGAGEGDYDAALWMELWARALRDPELAATRAELDGRWRQTIAEVVRYGQERGEFGPADPDEVRGAAGLAARWTRRADRVERHRGHAGAGAGAEPAARRARAGLRAGGRLRERNPEPARAAAGRRRPGRRPRPGGLRRGQHRAAARRRRRRSRSRSRSTATSSTSTTPSTSTPSCVKGFEKRYGVKVRESYFDSMSAMMAKLRAGIAVRRDLPERRVRRAAAIRATCSAGSTATSSRTSTRSTRTSTIPGTTRARSTPRPTGCTPPASATAPTRSTA